MQVLTQQQRYLEAVRMLTQLTASLGLRGLWLNLVVEAATGHVGCSLYCPKSKAMLVKPRVSSLSTRSMDSLKGWLRA